MKYKPIRNPIFAQNSMNPVFKDSRSQVIVNAQANKKSTNLRRKLNENRRQVLHILRNGEHLNTLSQVLSAQKGLGIVNSSLHSGVVSPHKKLSHILKIFTLIAFYRGMSSSNGLIPIFIQNCIIRQRKESSKDQFHKLITYATELVRSYEVPIIKGKKSYKQILINTLKILPLNNLAEVYTRLFQKVFEGYDLGCLDYCRSPCADLEFQIHDISYLLNVINDINTGKYRGDMLFERFLQETYLKVLSARNADSAITTLETLPFPTNIKTWTHLYQSKAANTPVVSNVRSNVRSAVRSDNIRPFVMRGPRRLSVEFPRTGLPFKGSH